MNPVASIYIPRMSISWDIVFITNVMNKFKIGNVSHVDYTPINKKHGFIENFEKEGFISAFIHFSKTDALWEHIKSGIVYRIPINNNEYWICLLNKNPIQRTLMNIHQVVENCRYLENIIEIQSKKIEQLEKKMEALQNQTSINFTPLLN
jgi:hypothetical protein